MASSGLSNRMGGPFVVPVLGTMETGDSPGGQCFPSPSLGAHSSITLAITSTLGSWRRTEKDLPATASGLLFALRTAHHPVQLADLAGRQRNHYKSEHVFIHSFLQGQEGDRDGKVGQAHAYNEVALSS